jgi:hypothetical protein
MQQPGAQHGERAPQVTLHGVDRHLQCVRNLRRIEILLKAQDDDHSRTRRQSCHELLNPLFENQFARSRRGGTLGNGVHRQFHLVASPPQLVDAAMAGDAAQPRDHMGGRIETSKIPVQPQEHVLRKVLGRRPVPQRMQRQAEHHRLVTPNQLGKSGGIAAAGLGERSIVLDWPGCRAFARVPNGWSSPLPHCDEHVYRIYTEERPDRVQGCYYKSGLCCAGFT